MAWSKEFWCGRGDSNPHALRRHPLKMVRLPVPPLPNGGERKHCIRELGSSQAIGFDSGEFTAAALRLLRRRLLLRSGRTLRPARRSRSLLRRSRRLLLRKRLLLRSRGGFTHLL